MPLGAVLGGWIAATLGLSVAFLIGDSIMVVASVAVAPWLRERVIEDALDAFAGPIAPRSSPT